MIAENKAAPPVCSVCSAEIVSGVCLLHPFDHPRPDLTREQRETMLWVEPSKALPPKRPDDHSRGWARFLKTIPARMEVIETTNADGRRIINARWSDPQGWPCGRDVSLPPHEPDPLNVLYVDYLDLMAHAGILTSLGFNSWKARYLAVQARRAS